MSSHASSFDVVIVGGGIIGLATAREIQTAFPDLHVAILEKERAIGLHQTSHNSGVVHSGLYYKPGSYKARLSRQGAMRLRRFCEANKLPFRVCGKVVVATDERELPRLQVLYERGVQNGLSGSRLITRDELRSIEPYANGLKAIHVPETAVVDFSVVAARLSELMLAAGGEIRVNAEVRSISEQPDGYLIGTRVGDIQARYLISCAGLQSDRVARLGGAEPPGAIVPFRGEYYRLKVERAELVRGLIYPVPDPLFPFLGVHFTRGIDNQVEAGPNAVLAFSREGYSRTQFSIRDTADILSYPGFWRMAGRHARAGAGEMLRSFSKTLFVRALQKLVPDIRASDLVEGGSGVRAQALDRRGQLVDDFVITHRHRSLHVCNAPSPAATASFAIAEVIVEHAERHFGWRGRRDVSPSV